MSDCTASLFVSHTVDSRYLEVHGTLLNILRYPYLDISDMQNLGKHKSNNHISQINMYNLTPEVRDISKILWKRGEIAPKEQFLLFSTIFCYLLLISMLKKGPDFHVEISGYSR